MGHERELVLDKGLSTKRGLDKINVVAVHYILFNVPLFLCLMSLGDEGEPPPPPK